jgi:hypothetical protein
MKQHLYLCQANCTNGHVEPIFRGEILWQSPGHQMAEEDGGKSQDDPALVFVFGTKIADDAGLGKQ